MSMTINGSVSVVGSLNAVRSISVLGNTAGATSAGPGSLALAGGSNVTLSGATAPGGMTLSINASAGAAAPFTHGAFQNFTRQQMANVTAITAISARPLFVPFELGFQLSHNELRWEMSRAAGASTLSLTVQVGLYSFGNSTSLARIGSLAASYSATSTAALSGVREFIASGWDAGTNLAPGQYVLGMFFSGDSTASFNFSVRGASTLSVSGLVGQGTNATTTATSILSSIPLDALPLGVLSVTTAGMPANVSISDVQQWTSMGPVWFGMRAT